MALQSMRRLFHYEISCDVCGRIIDKAPLTLDYAILEDPSNLYTCPDCITL